MKKCLLLAITTVSAMLASIAAATQADETTITITAQTPGATPFINNVRLQASQTGVLQNIEFKIAPKTGSVTRPLSASYTLNYLAARGNVETGTGTITLPVYGLYAAYDNRVTLTYRFMDGSSKEAATTITTAAFQDTCGYDHPTVLQSRTNSTSLSYDFIMIKAECSTTSPTIIDTDGALRWAGTSGFSGFAADFFNNSVYLAHGTSLYRNDLDGRVALVGDYASVGVLDFHHNIDRGKTGIILEADTASYVESVIMEVDDATGAVLKTWNMADIISAAMIAGGDDPSQFVYPAPNDWFHNNAVTYNRADDSLIVSSREDFLICLDYETAAIKWILGDPTKKWYQFSSLRQYAFALSPNSLPPVGQHSVSMTYDQKILVLDNGQMSSFHIPAGAQRNDARPRKYELDLRTKVAREVWNYAMEDAIYSPFCGSAYEDAPLNYLIDYAIVSRPPDTNRFAQLVGLNAQGEKIFYYEYPATSCSTAFNSIPVHLEHTVFPAVGPQTLNLSTRGTLSAGDNTLIAGFIVTGTTPKTIVLRALGPSLDMAGVADAAANPMITLYDASGTVVAENDDWQTRPGGSYIASRGLAPTNPLESALLQNLTPGTYTAVARSNSAAGTGLVEAYDLSPSPDSTVGNLSTRGTVAAGDNVLISGFIVGQVARTTVVIRALGPSLASHHVSGALSDPTITIYDRNGSMIAFNDNWQDNPGAAEIERTALAPTEPAEAALALNLPAGTYTAIVRGAGSDTGVALVEVYHIQ